MTPSGDVYMGEVGLTGEIRRVSRIEERVKEAKKLGFTRAVKILVDGQLQKELRLLGLIQFRMHLKQCSKMI